MKVAASTLWAVLYQAGIDPVPQRTVTTWATFLRSQAQAISGADFFETTTLTGSEKTGVDLQLPKAVKAHYDQAIASGHGTKDWTVLYEVIKARN